MKERLDVLLVNRGLAPSREKAKTMIMEGNVFVNNNREDKAGSTFPDDCNIEIHGKTLQYVSRGGLKLEKAMKHFDITMDGKVCMDIGASTAVLQTVCFKMVLKRCMPWMSDMASLHGSCVRTSAWCAWKRPISGM